jgi:hypothetical protein
VLAARTVAGGARVVTVMSFVFEEGFLLITGDPKELITAIPNEPFFVAK